MIRGKNVWERKRPSSFRLLNRLRNFFERNFFFFFFYKRKFVERINVYEFDARPRQLFLRPC